MEHAQASPRPPARARVCVGVCVGGWVGWGGGDKWVCVFVYAWVCIRVCNVCTVCVNVCCIASMLMRAPVDRQRDNRCNRKTSFCIKYANKVYAKVSLRL